MKLLDYMLGAKSAKRGYRIYKLCRAHVAKHPVCLWCGSTKRVEAHHVIPVAVCAELAEDPENLRSLCRPCHLSVGHFCNYSKFNRNLDTCILAKNVANPVPTFLSYNPSGRVAIIACKVKDSFVLWYKKAVAHRESNDR